MNKYFHVPKRQIDEALASKPEVGVRLLEPYKTFAISNDLPFKVLEDHLVSGNAEIHKKIGDLWLCLEGESEFVVGGELVNPYVENDNPDELRSAEAEKIKDGDTVILKPGDWLWIEPGCPHLHNAKDGTARLMIIKIPVT